MGKREAYDLCILGCGSGGFAAAMRAVDFGKDVCIVEAREIGGAGLRWGALASKTMWEMAKDYDVAVKLDRGYCLAGQVVSFPMVRDAVLSAVREKQQQMFAQIEAYAPQGRKGLGSITYKKGWGTFLSCNEVEVRGRDGSRERVFAENFLIATGSRPRKIPHIPFDRERVITSDHVLSLKSFPKRLMIIGAGIVGCEYATIFSNFGQTEVFLVDHKETVIPFEDEDVSGFVSKSLSEGGVRIIHSAVLKEIVRHDTHLEVLLSCEGDIRRVSVDTVLVSVGRVPNIDYLNLGEVCVREPGLRCLSTNENCCFRDHIYAAGDVTHHPALVNLAEMEGRYAVKHMFDTCDWPLNYDNMPTVMFFKPAVAAVGLNEKMCRERGIAFRVATYGNRLLTRALAMGQREGFVKILVSDDGEQRILGMRSAGPHVSSTVISIAMIMDAGRGLHDIFKTVYPHPTMAEGIQECLRLLVGKSVYKPLAFPDQLKIRSWHPERGYCSEGSEELQVL